MGLFGPTKTAEEKLHDIFVKYGLDMDSYDTRQIKEENSKNLKEIANSVLANKLFQAGMALSFAPAPEQAKLGYLTAIVNQNWIMMRQNELIIRLLEKKPAK